MNHTVSRRGALATLAAVPLVAAGCAKHGSSTATGTLNVGQISNSVAFFPLFIAEQKGYFTKEGVKMGQRPRLGTGAKVAAALKSGSIDLGAGVLTDALNLANTDSSTRLVAELVDRYYVDIIVGTSFGGPPASASLDERIRALKGKKIGITGPGSGTEALVTYLFHRVGMKSNTDAELVNLGGAATSALGALKAGRVDALSFFQPIAQEAEAANIGTTYISPARGDVPDLGADTHGVVFTTESVMKKKSKEVAAFQRAIASAEHLIHGDANEVTTLLGQYLKGADPKVISTLVPILQQEIPDGIKVARGSFDTAIRFHQTTGLVPHPPSYDQLVPASVRAGG